MSIFFQILKDCSYLFQQAAHTDPLKTHTVTEADSPYNHVLSQYELHTVPQV